jgi:hypothetical protein
MNIFWFELRIYYKDLFNLLENYYGYSKKLSNFGNYRLSLSDSDKNLPKIRILSPGITISSTGIESKRKNTEINTNRTNDI